MAKLVIPSNWDEVPAQYIPCSVGVHLFEITRAEPASNKAGTGINLEVELKCQDEGPDHNKNVKDWIPTSMMSKLKQLALAAGVALSGDSFECTDLIGQSVKALIKHSSFKPSDAGPDDEPVLGARVDQYLDSAGNKFKNTD